MDRKCSSEVKNHWVSNEAYKIVMLMSMINEMSVVFCATTIGHSRFYIHSIILFLTIVLGGIPLAYSLICVAQYTNSDVLNTWNFFPLFRGFGSGTIFIMALKLIHVTTICSWYLVYTYYAAMDPPPWFSCEYFNTTRCMVKRINISVFQHCIESLHVYLEDCEMYTASYFFFEREIGGQTTSSQSETCFLLWKPFVAALFIHALAFILSVKKRKCLEIIVKLVLLLIICAVFLFFALGLSTSGSWMTTNTSFHWEHYNLQKCIETMNSGFLMLGTGSGALTYLSSDAAFRSAATITAILTSLLATIITVLLALIIFCGINIMSYYHGQEEAVIEVGESYIFEPLGSLSEILSYFDNQPLWGFFWFLMIFCCLLCHLLIVNQFLNDFFWKHSRLARKYKFFSRFMISLLTLLLSSVFQCSDLLAGLTDALEIAQLIASLCFAMSLYWFYGFTKHSVDITFMIGVKASYYWRILWCLNPMFIACLIYGKFASLYSMQYPRSYVIESLSLASNVLVVYVLLSVYLSIVAIGSFIEIITYYRSNKLLSIFSANEMWGPKDTVLFKSRKMFVPEIMTREFLYRQVRIRGYESSKIKASYEDTINVEESTEKLKWSALTSN